MQFFTAIKVNIDCFVLEKMMFSSNINNFTAITVKCQAEILSIGE